MESYNGSSVLTLDGFKTAMTRAKTETDKKIAQGISGVFKVVDAVPETDGAQENVLYMVKNSESGHYDVYHKINGKMEWLDDTTIDLSGYVTSEELSQQLSTLGGGAVYTGTKTSLDAFDDSVITAFFSKADAPAPKAGDMFVVLTVVDNVTYELTAYRYDGENWVSITGNVDADKVILQEDITLAGDYTQVGNLSKSANGTATLAAKGKSVAGVLTEILSKRLQPSITAQPSVSGFTLTGAKAVEAGTSLASAAYTAASLNPGSYQYGPETGVAADSWTLQRITDLGTEQVLAMAVPAGTGLSAGTDDNGGAGFIIGDAGGDNVVSSLKYKAIANHGAGVTANDNLGSASSPVVAIAAGTKEKVTSAYTAFRNVFYGASTDKPALDSAFIRSLTKSGKAYAAGTLTLNVPAGAQRVCIACITGKTGVTKVINETAMNADVTGTFVKSAVAVEGANGYAAKDYNVWVFEPAVPYENAAVLKVTLG